MLYNKKNCGHSDIKVPHCRKVTLCYQWHCWTSDSSRTMSM